MALDPERTAIVVRVTARVSAAVFTASLIAAARRLSAGPASDVELNRRIDIGAFAVFVLAHTIHFASVGLLAAATGGRTIRDAGGYAGTLLVGAAFYAACGAVLRAKSRTTTRWANAADGSLDDRCGMGGVFSGLRPALRPIVVV